MPGILAISAPVNTTATPSSASAFDFSMRVMRACGIWTAQNRDMEHARHLDVADMQRPPGNFRIGVGSINRLTYDGIVSHRNTSSVLIAFS